MKAHWFQWVLIIGSAAIFILADSLSANWGKGGNWLSLLIMIFFAPLGYVLFGILNSFRSLSVSSALVNILLVIGTICVGIFFFEDKLDLKQIIGLFFAVIAIGLLA